MRMTTPMALTLALSAGFVACSDDDDNGNNNDNNNNSVTRSIVINEIYYRGDAASDYIELKNIGTEAIDLTPYRFCLRVGTYPALTGLEIFGPGTLTLEPNALVTFRAPEDLANAGSIALYDRGGDFTNPDALIDFVQWGASQVADSRADVAVAANEWTTVDGGFAFVAAAETNEAIAFDGSRSANPAADYANAVPSPSFEDGVMEVAARVTLSADAAVPPVTTPSTGAGSALVTVGANWLVVLGQLSDLSGPLLDIADFGPIHLHYALPEPGQTVTEATGPVAYPLVVDPAADGLAANYTLRVRPEADALDESVAPQDRLQAFRDGRYYFNVHTETNPSGELRGQVDFGTNIAPPPVRRIVINEVLYGGDETEDFVELKNVGTETVDVGDWFFCFRAGAYPQLSSLTIIGGSEDFSLEPGEIIVLAAGQNLGDASGAVALYANNNGFTDPANMRDYVRYGSAENNSERADVAVQAGLWTEPTADSFDFVETASTGESLALVGDPAVEPSTSSLFANGIVTPGQDNDAVPDAARQIIINEIFHGGDKFVDYIELKNVGAYTVNLRGFAFCLRVGVYPTVSSLPIFGDGDYVLEPGEFLVVRAPEDLGDAASVALYWQRGAFANPDAMADFVQYGAAAIENTRGDVAVTAGLWTETDGALDFVPTAATNRSISLVQGDDRLENTSADFDAAPLSFGQDNDRGDLASVLALSPDNEVPPVVVQSTAAGTVIAASYGSVLSVIGSFEGLTSALRPIPEVGPAHIHLAVRAPTQAFEDATGPIGYVLTAENTDAETAGLIYGRFNLVQDSALDPSVAPDDPRLALLQGQFYINIHTLDNPAGELRAQLTFDADVAPPAGLARDIAINEVRYTGDAAADFVELINDGPGRLDVTNWEFCFRQGAYATLSTLTILTGNDLVLDPGEIIAFRPPADVGGTGRGLDDVAAGLGLYIDGSFGSADSIVDYIKWGNATIAGTRADVAIAAGIWATDGADGADFISTAAPGESTGFDGDNTGPGVLSTSEDYVNGPESPGQPN